MRELLAGLAFGLVLQVSVGPVFFAVVGEAMARGMRHGLSMVLGVAVVDALYVGLAVSGVAAILRLETMRSALEILGSVVLIAFGLRFMLTRSAPDQSRATNAAARRAFLAGFALTLSNPLTILFWLGAFGALVASRSVEAGAPLVAFAAGCVAATLLFLGSAVLAAQRVAGLAGGRALLWLHRGVGAALAAFGLRLLFKF
jgi:threonine/homoserine/homoserine lactone efflux protein